MLGHTLLKKMKVEIGPLKEVGWSHLRELFARRPRRGRGWKRPDGAWRLSTRTDAARPGDTAAARLLTNLKQEGFNFLWKSLHGDTNVQYRRPRSRSGFLRCSQARGMPQIPAEATNDATPTD